jgi:hypothetical protein
MQGYFRFKECTPDSWDYYYIAAVNVESGLSEWGLIRIHRHNHYEVLREPIESFPGEGVLIRCFGLKYLLTHLFKERVVEEVYFDD